MHMEKHFQLTESIVSNRLQSEVQRTNLPKFLIHLVQCVTNKVFSNHPFLGRNNSIFQLFINYGSWAQFFSYGQNGHFQYKSPSVYAPVMSRHDMTKKILRNFLFEKKNYSTFTYKKYRVLTKLLTFYCRLYFRFFTCYLF